MIISSTHTCVFHRLFYEGIHEHHIHIQNITDNAQSHNSPLLTHYMKNFAFLWWGSIGVLVLGIYAVKKKNKVTIKNQNEIRR
jgi:hypothetical protein